MKRKFIRIGIILLTVALIAVAALPAMASNAAPKQSLHNIQGKVISIASDSSSFIVQEGSQPQITVKVDQNTRYLLVPMGKVTAGIQQEINEERQDFKKGKEGPETRANFNKKVQIPDNWKSNLGWLETVDSQAKFSDIQVGDRIIASINTDGNVARQVLIFRAPVIQTVKGTVSALTASSVTITPTGANAVALNIDGDTRVNLKGLLSVQTGQYAMAVYNKNTLVAQIINVQAAAPAASLKSIALTPSTVSGNLTVGGKIQFGATGTFANGVTANITSQVNWASSNQGAATINSAGLATGVAAGTTSIVASKDGVTSPVVTVTVGP